MDLHPEEIITGKRNFETIPAINLFKGIPVIKGMEDYEPLKDKDEQNIDIHKLIDELKERFNKALMTDINGINTDKPQLELFKDISRKMKLWIDAGSRSRDCAIDTLVAGAEKVVISTKTLIDMEELDKILELSENVAFDIDYDNGIVSPNKRIREMSPLSLADELKNLGIEEVIFTDFKHLHSDSNFNFDIGKTLIHSDLKIYFHGRFDESTKMLKETNLAGVIIEVEKLL